MDQQVKVLVIGESWRPTFDPWSPQNGEGQKSLLTVVSNLHTQTRNILKQTNLPMVDSE